MAYTSESNQEIQEDNEEMGAEIKQLKREIKEMMEQLSAARKTKRSMDMMLESNKRFKLQHLSQN